MPLRSFERSIRDMLPVDDDDLERLEKIVSGKLTFPSVPIRDLNQPVLQRPLPAPPSSRRGARLVKKEEFTITHTTLTSEQVLRYEEAEEQRRLLQLDHDSIEDDIRNAPAGEDYNFNEVSDRSEAYQYMDEHFSFWEHNRRGRTSDVPYDMTGVGGRPHSALSEWNQRLWLDPNSSTRGSDTKSNIAEFSDLQDENSDRRLAHSHRELRQLHDDDSNNIRQSQQDYGTELFQNDYGPHQLQTGQKPRLIDRFDKLQPRDKQPRKRVPIIPTAEAENSSSVLVTKSANEKRSARQKMKRRGRRNNQDTVSPPVQSESGSDKRPEEEEEEDNALARKPTILRLVGDGESKRKQVAKALLENHIDVNRESELIALMEVITGERNKNTGGDGEHGSEDTNENTGPEVFTVIKVVDEGTEEESEKPIKSRRLKGRQRKESKKAAGR